VLVQGGKGFAGGTVANNAASIPPEVYNHGISQGASDALDAQTLWVQTVRAPIMPPPSDQASADRGAVLFAANCATCHGGDKWTKSQIFYAANPAFDANPINAGGQPRDPGVTALGGGQIERYFSEGEEIRYLENVGTFNAADAIEIRSNGKAPLGGAGFNVPALLGVGYHAPYLHDGGAQTLEGVMVQHNFGAGKIADQFLGQQVVDLINFLKTIDGATPTFRSAGDDFRDAVGP
jgi:cytochrome c peroxidase